MADEQSPVDDTPDVSLLDTDFNAPLQETPSETAVEKAADEGTDTQEEPKEGEESTSEDEQPSVEKQEPAQDDEAAIKARNEAYARQRIAERQRTRQAVAQQLDQTYGAKSAEELVEEGYSEQQAQIEALRQEMQYKEQRTQIAELNAGMQAEAVNVANDFSVFNPNSADYDQEFADLVAQQYQTAARLQMDDNGIIVNADVPLYDFYAQMNNIYNRGATKGQQQGQQAAQQMLSRTENPGGSSSTSQSNSLDDLEERIGNVVIT